MSPPIREGDGTGLGANGFTEVREGDGTVLWTSEPAIPDSVVHRWKFSEGSGSAVSDSTGSLDGSVDGPSWSSGDWVEGYALDGDGTDDVVSFSTAWDISTISAGGFSVAFTVKTTDDGAFLMGSHPKENDTIFYFEIGKNFASSGHVGAAIRDEDATDSGYDIESGGAINDGEPHRVCFVCNDPAGDENSADLYQDATESKSVVSSGTLGNNWGDLNEWPFFARERRGYSDHLDGILDDIIIYDSPLTGSEVDRDYNAQPWS